jgi:hypothetical protein
VGRTHLDDARITRVRDSFTEETPVARDASAMALPLHNTSPEPSPIATTHTSRSIDMTVRNAVVVTALAIVSYSTTSLIVPARVMRNPTCCFDANDCPSGDDCDYSESCGDMPGRCITVLGRTPARNGV